MYIKSIVLDGFKSYGNRVEITGFDPEFNAITGLNGTGKSNILDSICFVLGITNLSNVRAASLQELIYKHGQAGIIKATVSITFDNRDRAQCPIGYENHDEITVTRQVVMGGKNKYLINGINVQNKRVSDLFCSVQLNVNNPHFLIMQGRITKVLNMKPPEILSMVEEAAGTRMYEAKKQAAQKTIEKKDAKLRELNDIIREDIAPKLQKLQDERAQFQEYQKVVRELENVSRLYVAYKYVSAEENLKKAQDKVSEVQRDIQGKTDEINTNVTSAEALQRDIEELTRRVENENGCNLKQLEKDAQALEKVEAAASAAHRAAKEAVTSHDRRARLIASALTDDEQALEAKKNILNEASSTFENLRAASEASEAALVEAQARFLSVSTGNEGASESLQDQLMAAKQEASEASTSISQVQMEKKHAEERLKTLEREFRTSSAQFSKDQENIGRHQAQLDQIQANLSNMNFSEARNTELKATLRRLQADSSAARDNLDRLASRLQRCQFQYSPPERNFDASRVHGIVARLINVHDPVYCTALETAAGGRLYNVVVDTDATVDQLLRRGNIQTRTTMIPLNKITGSVIDDRTLRLAQQIGGGPANVQRAVDLISYSGAVQPAMAFVFGSTFICKDADTANKVTFHPQIRKRCVTVDGDVYDPAGTLSGGAKVKGGSVLVQIQQLQQLEQELQRSEQQLAQCQAELSAMQAAANSYLAEQQRYDMMSHELGVIRARLATTSHAQTHAEIESLRARISEFASQLQADKARQAAANAKARELEDKVKDIRGHREREFKRAEADLKKAKKDAEHHSSSWRQREQEFATLQLEVAELEAGVRASQAQLAEATAAAARLAEVLRAASDDHTRAEDAVKEIQARIRTYKAEIASRNGEIARLAQQKEELLANNNDIGLQIRELQFKIKELETEATECGKKISGLEREHAWVAGERQYFGAAGGLYDFAARQAHVAGARLAQLRERRERLARGLNARAHTLLGKEEEQYQDVLRKKQIVEADRAKLVQVMAELDEKKKRTLLTACEQVNRDFGSIFSTLLPGAQARLLPPEGKSVLDGLEVKVGFNNTWKESLGELSGGQRSLVALSLVLAMLLFKPAPLYILDEVDAALDLSHTQNIGHMLKEHFTHSQFIIVSLKDGMFNNANVLFRTRFVDGMSAVQRTVNRR